jgi:NADPH2:quinone reductase
MRAIGVTELGDESGFQVLDVPTPPLTDGAVRIRVHAATVNPTDTAYIRGAYFRSGEAPAGPYVPGMDAAGVVSEVGPGSRFTVGQEVAAVVLPTSASGGAYADELVLPEEQVVPVPAGVGAVPASTLLMNALTARLVLDALAVPAGGTLAVTGAAGAFGGYVVQLAKADGLRVVADAKDTDVDLVRSLGADDVVARGEGFVDAVRALVPRGVDGLADGAVLDGGVLGAIRDGGALATIRGWTGPGERDIEVHAVMVFGSAGDTAKLERLRQQVEEGVLTLRVATTFPAAQAAAAHTMLAGGGVRGRIVLDFTS